MTKLQEEVFDIPATAFRCVLTKWRMRTFRNLSDVVEQLEYWDFTILHLNHKHSGQFRCNNVIHTKKDQILNVSIVLLQSTLNMDIDEFEFL